MDEQIGKRIGNYVITELLAEGGMGAVYLAEHPEIGRRVAIKMLDPAMAADQDLCKRFLAEARAIARIEHPNIIDIFDFGRTIDGQLYIVMERLRGRELAELMDHRGAMSPSEAQPYLEQICDGLQAAHDHGVVHRDLKPENVFILEGERLALKIFDFGIAKLLDQEPRGPSMTIKGVVMGTPTTISPEQAAGQIDRIGPASDIYSLGVTLYWMLAGRPPFANEPHTVILARHITDPPPPLQQLAPSVSPAVAEVVHRCLEKDPFDRPPSAAFVARAFAEALARPWSTAPSPAPAATPAEPPAAKPKSRSATFRGTGAPPRIVPAVPKAPADVAGEWAPAAPDAPAAPATPPRPSPEIPRPTAPPPPRPVAATPPPPVVRPDPTPPPPAPPAEEPEDLLGALTGGQAETVTDADEDEPGWPEPELDEPEPEPEPSWPEPEPEPMMAGADLDAPEMPGDPFDAAMPSLLEEAGVVGVRGPTGELEPFIEPKSLQRKLLHWGALIGGGVAAVALVVAVVLGVGRLSSDTDPAAGEPSRAGRAAGLDGGLAPLRKVDVAQLKQALVEALKPGQPLAEKIASLSPGSWNGVRPQLLEQLRAAPKNVAARLLLGQLLVSWGRVDQAAELFREATAIDPQSAEARLRLGEALHALGELGAALSHYKAALAIDPRLGQAHLRLGQALQAAGKGKQAIKAYQNAARADPGLAAEAHYRMGVAHSEQKHTQQEIAELEAALEIDPNHVGARVALGYAQARLGHHEHALKQLDQAIQLNPKNPMAHFYRGTVLYNTRQPEQAIAAYRQAIALRPKFARAHYYLGQIYQDQGNRAQAISQYKAAVAADPNYEPAILALTKLERGE